MRPAPVRPASCPATSDMLERLDSKVQPGITEAEFQNLFVRCECGLFTTRRAFGLHDCRNEVIDLTGED
jgi:hypothetical protein